MGKRRNSLLKAQVQLQAMNRGISRGKWIIVGTGALLALAYSIIKNIDIFSNKENNSSPFSEISFGENSKSPWRKKKDEKEKESS